MNNVNKFKADFEPNFSTLYGGSLALNGTGLAKKSALRELNKYQEQSFFLYIELYNLDEISSTFGHSVGEKLLEMMVQSVVSLPWILRVYKITYKGIGIWCKGDRQNAKRVANSIFKVVNKPFEISDEQFYLHLKMGISLCPDDAADASELLRNASMALHFCNKGKSLKFLIYNCEMTELTYNRFDMHNQLRKAIENNELSLCFQPLVNIIGTQPELYGFEALVRWENQKLGSVAPDRFIPLAEEIDMIQEIGAWVLNESCEFIKKLINKTPNMVVSVNVSVKQLLSEDFIEVLEGVVKRHGVEPKNICIEITESALIESFDEIQKIIGHISRQGFLVALDDFGSGYSSLNYLSRLSIDVLKIDKDFTKKIAENENDFYLIKAIIAMAKDLKLRFVAEGVETLEILKMLKTLGCGVVQGFYFNKALPCVEALHYLPELRDGHYFE